MENKMLKVKVSGSCRTKIATDQDRHSFDGVSGVMPYCSDEYIVGHAMRLFPSWIKKIKSWKVNYEGLIKIYVDDVQEIEGVPECVGKNIKEMSWEELQSLACYKFLREIPMYKDGDLRKAREKAYEQYEKHVNGKLVFKTKKDLEKFTTEKRERGLEDDEIKSLIGRELNMFVDSKDVSNSYNFSKLPNLIVE